MCRVNDLSSAFSAACTSPAELSPSNSVHLAGGFTDIRTYTTSEGLMAEAVNDFKQSEVVDLV